MIWLWPQLARQDDSVRQFSANMNLFFSLSLKCGVKHLYFALNSVLGNINVMALWRVCLTDVSPPIYNF